MEFIRWQEYEAELGRRPILKPVNPYSTSEKVANQTTSDDFNVTVTNTDDFADETPISKFINEYRQVAIPVIIAIFSIAANISSVVHTALPQPTCCGTTADENSSAVAIICCAGSSILCQIMTIFYLTSDLEITHDVYSYRFYGEIFSTTSLLCQVSPKIIGNYSLYFTIISNIISFCDNFTLSYLMKTRHQYGYINYILILIFSLLDNVAIAACIVGLVNKRKQSYFYFPYHSPIDHQFYYQYNFRSIKCDKYLNFNSSFIAYDGGLVEEYCEPSMVNATLDFYECCIWHRRN